MTRKVQVAVLFIFMSTMTLVPSSSQSAASGPRFALVIGNGNYLELAKLRNPANDAVDMAETLRTLGFNVELLVDADLLKMEDAVIRLGNNLSQSADSTGFFFYAGHGVQSGGFNYLIPSDARIPGDTFLKTKALPAQSVFDTLQSSRNILNVVVLDACRDNPFSWSRSGTRGLSVVGSQPTGSIIAYATSAGSVALDGTGRNGVFTSELLKHLKTPGVEIKEVFNRTGKAVSSVSGGKQVPAVYIQFFESAWLAGQDVKDSVPVKPLLNASDPGIKPTALSTQSVIAVTRKNVLVRGGEFLMGSKSSMSKKEEKPVHKVTVSDFLIMNTEITQADYVALIGNNPSYFVDASLPVEKVSWYDAINYANALSIKDGFAPAYQVNGKDVTCDWKSNGWRLPTEAEWEYAARDGSFSRNHEFSGSSTQDPVAWYGGNSGSTTHPVASKRPNELGLYDMSGNCWEWCWDYFGPYGSRKETDPTGPVWSEFRVRRGGGWYGDASDARTTRRESMNPDYQYYGMSFRLVRRP